MVTGRFENESKFLSATVQVTPKVVFFFASTIKFIRCKRQQDIRKRLKMKMKKLQKGKSSSVVLVKKTLNLLLQIILLIALVSVTCLNLGQHSNFVQSASVHNQSGE